VPEAYFREKWSKLDTCTSPKDEDEKDAEREVLDQCYECKLTTKDHREEPIKVTNIPSKPWDTVSIDHGGPYPDGHYTLL
jgi:hypothetical protein